MVTDVRHGTEDKLTPAGLVGKVGLGWVGCGDNQVVMFENLLTAA